MEVSCALSDDKMHVRAFGRFTHTSAAAVLSPTEQDVAHSNLSFPSRKFANLER